jgi:septum formation protein
MKEIILASQSPRRKQLLEWAEVPFEVIVANTDESFPPELSEEEVAVHIAQGKAAVVKERAPGRTILAADTIVVLDGEILGKPKDHEEAVAMLLKLQGRSHRVITGVCILAGDRDHSFADTTEVMFHPLTREQIEWYVDRYQPYDKAGAYAIQEWIGVVGIREVKGDFYNVMGLPVSRVVQFLTTLESIL